MTIYTKLNAARKEFHTLQLKKTGLNKFAGYYYFELSDFLIPALETFDKHGLCAFVSFGKELATLKVVDVEDGTSIELTSPMAEANLKGCHPIQNLGAVETYTRRYLWVAALEIVEHDALDSSKPLEKADPKNLKMPAMDGIGDDLPRETREFIQDVAAATTELVEADKAVEALAMIRSHQFEGDERIFLDRKLPSKVKTALRKAGQSETPQG